MPEEYRKLVFSSAELFLAASEFCQGTGALLAQDDVVEVSLTGEQDQPAVLRYTTGVQASVTEVTLSRDQLAAALIQFCRKRRIPVPRGGEKVLKIEDGRVALLVHVGD